MAAASFLHRGPDLSAFARRHLNSHSNADSTSPSRMAVRLQKLSHRYAARGPRSEGGTVALRPQPVRPPRHHHIILVY
jgi:hypothetical protein